ncbi:efflux RND transporter permease subunit [Marinobacter segnicrescens]|uniref:Multidrug efflux pump subunit AcrB n=1 Tax=Marinobacter segnicrescens TaxID=430453 RepID=A0A1I0A519_9GAMM|nr:efflux RND transporter permease subunit [Marinobacter segnicrescens]SES89189.1 Multidrug efflux pump subunit AcrB [Marinobacter segnicrescens]
MSRRRKGIIGFFVHHRVAANLVMILMLLAGALGLMRMNIQFFPTFALDIVNVQVVWSGAAAEDIEQGITDPLEQRFRSINGLKKMTSTSAQGVASITLEFEEGTEPIQAVDDVRQQVEEFSNLPADAETPRVSRVGRYEPVARLLMHGDLAPEELRRLAYRYEDELLRAGIDRIEITGLPEVQMSIDVPVERLQALGLSLDDIADRVQAQSRDLPAGLMGQQDATRELRATSQGRSPEDFADLSVIADNRERIRLGDIAIIRQEARDQQVTLTQDGKPAVELRLLRAEQGHSLRAAEILEKWMDETRPQLPSTVSLEVYDQTWELIDQRISLLTSNGLGGLVLVLILLYLFLPGRVALWVAVGIPTAFMAALGALWLYGGSINMMSLFALIMALGVIVDDAIVVGEDADAHARMGEQSAYASEGAAKRMVWPVLASSLTTVAAFMPLLVVSGVIGNILGDIPVVMICVLVASLLECFIVLPAHLRHAFTPGKPGARVGRLERIRQGFDRRFEAFRQGPCRRLSRWTLAHRSIVLASLFTLTAGTFGLWAGDRIGFSFFPTPEPSVLYANANFVAGTDRETVDRFLVHLEETLNETEEALGGNLILHAVTTHGSAQSGDGSARSGDDVGSMMLELVDPDDRTVRNARFVRAWRERIQLPPGMENLTITERQAGPPGRDVNVRLTGADTISLKRAAESLSAAMRSLPGVLDSEDDLPWGRQQLIYEVSPRGESLGLTTLDVGRQLRAAFDGRVVQIYQDDRDEIEVRVQLPREQRERVSTLSRLTIRLPDGRFVPLEQVITLSPRQGFDALRHADGQLAVEVTAQLDPAETTAGQVLESLRTHTLPELADTWGVRYSFEGRSADQRQTLNDMKVGAIAGLALMYVVLVWVFASWTTPLIVMAIIPFALIGAMLGHWLMGLKLTVLSLFGLFGLSGIVVNNAIILVSFYQAERRKGLAVNEALNEAVVQRVRAVILTSLTTIGGLLPLMFETSLQAQFLIPMAASITFGLALATVLVLVVIPALLSLLEQFHEWRAPTRQVEGPET